MRRFEFSPLLHLVLVLGLCSTAQADEQSARAADPVNVPAIGQDSEYVVYLREKNRSSYFPTLDYGGFREYSWGDKAERVTLPERETYMLTEFSIQRELDDQGQLVGVRFDKELDSADIDASRKRLIRAFRRVFSDLVGRYGYPNEPINPPSDALGASVIDEDRYIAGQIEGYRVMWTGPGTDVRLDLGRDRLQLGFLATNSDRN